MSKINLERTDYQKQKEHGNVISSAKENIKVTDYLPHRYPFLFVDRVVDISKDKIIAVKNVSTNEHYFTGHFPNEPIMPGVLIIESLAQTCAILAFKVNNKKPNDGYSVYLSGVDKAKFRHPVRPGDALMLHAEIAAQKQSLWRFKCQAFVDEKIVCSLVLTSSVRESVQY